MGGMLQRLYSDTLADFHIQQADHKQECNPEPSLAIRD
jgi:hypothetical protein